MKNALLSAGIAAAVLLGAAGARANELGALARPLDPAIAAGVRGQLHKARYLGEMMPTRMVTLNVHLAYPHPDAVKRFDDVVNNPDSPMYGHFLKPSQFVAAFAPSAAEYAAVSRELAANGLRTSRTFGNRKMLKIVAPAATVERYFHTRLARVLYDGREHFANVTPAVVPAALRGRVMAVVGFDDFLQHDELAHRKSNVVVPMPVPNPPVNLPTGSTPETIPAGITPLDMETAYDYPIHKAAAANGKGVTIAIEAAYSFLDTDIYYFWGAFNVDHTGTLEVIDPEENLPATFSPTDSAEVTIDVEQSTSNAPGATEKVYTVPAPLDIELEDTYNFVVSDSSVDVVSTSFGSCETDDSASSVAADNDTFEQGSIEGQSMFAAAGDNGAADCVADGPNAVDFPAISPEVASMGGTTLTLNPDMSIASESGWSCLATTGVDGSACGNGANGGGVSTIFSLPSWQQGLAAASYPNSGVSATMRNEPDMSLNADVNTSYAVWFAGTADLGYGGTSFVGPNLAAVFADEESVTGQRMGRAENAFYYGYHHGLTQAASGYHDITTGDNVNPLYTGNTGYASGVGFDDDTGWGSFDAGKFFSTVPVPAGPTNL